MSELKLVSVTIDGKTVQVPAGTLLVEAAKKAGVSIPVFCYHPKLEPAGVCRMCLVKVEKMPKLVTACTTPVSDGMVVDTRAPEVAEARKGVLEFLLINHPLDCPICDKGGECDLQDLTFAYGPGMSRLQDGKLHKRKAVDLGNFIVLDEERCILCRRCTRFDAEVAGEGNLVVGERAHDAVITTNTGHPYDSYFSGNTIELCPVGALTSRVYRFKARPWDLVRQPAICTGCPVGCNVELHFRFGELLRVVSRENPQVDGGWLCDRGRFNYRYVHSDQRLTQPLVRRGDKLVPATWNEALGEVARRVGAAREQKGARSIGVIGGGRLTNEEAYLLQKLARLAWGTPNVDWRVGSQQVGSLAAFPSRMTDLDSADAVLVVDLQVAERAPVLDLRVRAAASRGASLVLVGPAPQAYAVPHTALGVLPGQTAATLRELRAALAGPAVHANGAPAVQGSKGNLPAEQAAGALRSLGSGRKLVAIWGGEDPEAGEALLELLEELAGRGVSVHLLIPGQQANARGAEAAGCHPALLPGARPVADSGARREVEEAWKAALPAEAAAEGLSTAEMLVEAAAGGLQVLYLVGANLAQTFPDRALTDAALDQVPFLVVQDLFLTETAAKADVVLPAVPFVAKGGHYTTLDGQVQAVKALAAPDGEARPDGVILRALAEASGVKLAASEQELACEIQSLAGALVGAGDAPAPAAPRPVVAEAAQAIARAARQLTPAPAGPAGGTAAEGDLATPEAEPAGSTAGGALSLVVVGVERLYAGGGTSRFDPEFHPRGAEARAWMHPEDARRLEVSEGEAIELSAPAARLAAAGGVGTAGQALRIPVGISKAVVPGTVQLVKGAQGAPAERLLRLGAAGAGSALRVTVARCAVEEVA